MYKCYAYKACYTKHIITCMLCKCNVTDLGSTFSYVLKRMCLCNYYIYFMLVVFYICTLLLQTYVIVVVYSYISCFSPDLRSTTARSIGRHYLSNATCLIRPHLFYACFAASRITIIRYIIRQV